MTLTIGVLGAARIAPKAVIDPARVVHGVKVLAVAARQRDRATEFAAVHGIETVYDDYRALIEDPKIDLVYNALPIHLHAPWSIAALRAKKHVLCEKPFAMNLSEAELMLAAARDNQVRIIEAFHYRYHPGFDAALAWLDEPGVGPIRRVEAAFDVPIPYRPSEIRHHKETGGGAFMDLGCYCVSWALSVLNDEPTEITADARLTTHGVDEQMTARLVFASGTEAELSASMAPDVPLRRFLKITGDRGEMHFDNPLALHEGARITLTRPTGEPWTQTVSALTTYTWQLQAVVRALDTGTALPTEGEAILRQQRVLDAVYDAAGLRHLRLEHSVR